MRSIVKVKYLGSSKRYYLIIKEEGKKKIEIKLLDRYKRI